MRAEAPAREGAMIWLDILFAFVAAVIFTLLLAGLLGWRHPAGAATGAGEAILFAFIVLFLGAWVGGIWIAPLGPTLGGVSWVPFALAALFVMFLLLAAAPLRRQSPGDRPVQQQPEEPVPSMVFGSFFWLLVIALLVALIVAYW